MSSKPSSSKEKQILSSWETNAKAWTTAIRERQIESREKITNKAIIETVLQYKPKSVIDIGCGEGWLTHTLAKNSIEALGIDAIPELIETASKVGSAAQFKVMSYQQLSEFEPAEKFELALCNFSLIGKESVEELFNCIPRLISEEGHFIIQTLHPVSACGDHPYEDGWRQGSWDGFSSQFTNPAPWYFRTLETWQTLFAASGLMLKETIEPLNPNTQTPASILFIGQRVR